MFFCSLFNHKAFRSAALLTIGAAVFRTVVLRLFAGLTLYKRGAFRLIILHLKAFSVLISYL